MALSCSARAPSLLARLSGQPRGARAGTMAPPRRLALELPGGALLHFVVGAAAGARRVPGAAELLGPQGRSYALCAPGAPGGDGPARVRAARELQRLLLQLRRGPLRRCALRPLLLYGPDGGARGVRRGVLLHDPGLGPGTERLLLQLLDAHPEAPRPLLGQFVSDARHRLWHRLWEPREGQGWQQLDAERVAPAPEPALHPAVPDLPNSAVFPHREAARAVLAACTPFISEAQAVLELVDQCPKQVERGKFPVIVIEGLDATGKTTVTQSVAESLHAVLLKSPPASISQWRSLFDDEPTIIRRAFYALGNYIVAAEIAKESTRSPVIVDRYWHSTASYAIATEVSGGLQHLPPDHHAVYRWPQDLLRPDLVVLLALSPEERLRRMRARGLDRTQEEVQLEANSIFRQKVETCYRRMEEPACCVVDASPSPETVLQTVLSLIRDRCPSGGARGQVT